MAGGIAALAELLLGPHSTGCCRPVVAAIADLIVNDPPSLREIRWGWGEGTRRGRAAAKLAGQ